MKETRNFS